MKGLLAASITLCIYGMGMADRALAIVVRGDAPANSILVESIDYPEVVALYDGRAVGTLIDDDWILTAAHVATYIAQDPATRTVLIGGKLNLIAEVVVHPSWDPESLGDPDVFDLALLRLEQTVRAELPVRIYQGREEPNAVVTIVGWGRTGDGHNPELIRDGRFRRGENKIDEATPRLRFRFDEPGSSRVVPLEAVSGPGDSGGPAFIEVGGARYLAGISSFQEDEHSPGVFGVTENYERVSDHIDWIEATTGSH
jgi:secreted trypsin-like serine protease